MSDPVQIIDDDDISCPFPHHVFERTRGHSGPETTDLFLSIARYARLCGKINRQLYSATSLVQRPEQTLENILALHEELKEWWASLSTTADAFALDHLPHASDFPSQIERTRHIILRCWYYSALFALHRACREPGFELLEKSVQSMTAEQSMRFKQIAADGIEAARSMCLLIQQIKIENQTPIW